MKIWSYMTDEDKQKYFELKEELLNALTQSEVRHYANRMHELLDNAEMKVLKSDIK